MPFLLLLLLQAPAPRQVAFQSQGVTLAGEITYPPGNGPFPAVALVHGSGPATRAGNAPLVTLFRDLGFAVLAYDKRGTGASGGTYRGAGVRNSDSMIPLLGADASAVGLYLLGGLDRSVPTAQSVSRIRQVDAVAPGRLTVLVLPTGDHSLFDARTGTALPFGNELVAWLHRAGVRDFSD